MRSRDYQCPLLLMSSCFSFYLFLLLTNVFATLVHFLGLCASRDVCAVDHLLFRLPLGLRRLANYGFTLQLLRVIENFRVVSTNGQLDEAGTIRSGNSRGSFPD